MRRYCSDSRMSHPPFPEPSMPGDAFSSSGSPRFPDGSDPNLLNAYNLLVSSNFVVNSLPEPSLSQHSQQSQLFSNILSTSLLSGEASVFRLFLADAGNGRLRCLFVCERNSLEATKSLAREDRAIGHIRAHFNHRPFVCTGSCGKTPW